MALHSFPENRNVPLFVSEVIRKAIMKQSLSAIAILFTLGANSAHALASTIVEFKTTSGNFSVSLNDDVAPISVANFLNYATGAAYTDSIVHRSISGFVIQGGGYNTALQSLATQPPIPLESTAITGLSNLRGTLAMARTTVPNSARNQWYINLVDNPFLDATQSSPGYAVFGQVLGNGMTVVDAIAALPVFAFTSPFNELPLRNYTVADFQAGVQPTINTLVIVNSVAVVPESSTQLMMLLGLAGIAAYARRSAVRT